MNLSSDTVAVLKNFSDDDDPYEVSDPETMLNSIDK